MKRITRAMENAPPEADRNLVSIWNVACTDWVEISVRRPTKIRRDANTVVARLDHIEDLLHLGVEIHALTAPNQPPWRMPLETHGVPAAGSRSSTRASSVRSSTKSSPVRGAASQDWKEVSSSQSSFTHSPAGSSKTNSTMRSSYASPGPVPGPSSSPLTSVSQARRSPPPSNLSARAAGKRPARSPSLEVIDGTPAGLKVKRERRMSPDLKRVPAQTGNPEEPIDVDEWAAEA